MTVPQDEKLGKDAVLVYAGHHYGVFDLDDYTARIAGLMEVPLQPYAPDVFLLGRFKKLLPMAIGFFYCLNCSGFR